jgi:hypothetical protein
MKNTLRTAIAITFFASTSAHAQQAVQWSNGHWYFLSGNSMGQSKAIDARNSAIAAGGHLITINSEAEAVFVTQVLFWQYSQANIWLGAHRTSDGSWAWDTGEPWGYANFAPSFCNYGSDAIRMGDAGGNCGTGNSSIGPWAIWPNDFPVYVRTGIEWDADCNGDGLVDFGQIRNGALRDTNGNNIPDCCENGLPCGCAGDIFDDDVVNGADLGILINQWGAATVNTVSDLNHDGRVDGIDLGTLLTAWGPCPN